MKTPQLITVCLVLAVGLVACSSLPTRTPLLEQTRIAYSAAQNNSAVTTYAQVEMEQAREAMLLANEASNNLSAEEVDILAYLAKQKIALAQEVAKQKTAEASVATATKERDAMRLAQRTKEVDQANLKTDQANSAALMAQNAAAQAQADSNSAARKEQDAKTYANQLEAQLSELSAKKTERGIVITIGDLLFGSDRSQLNPDGLSSAKKIATVLQENPQRVVLIEGYTDSVGSDEYNQALSERRANAVKVALLQMGISESRIMTRGYGEQHPVASNATAQERQMNRRVEIVLSDESGKIAQR